MKSPCLELDIKCHEYVHVIKMMEENPGMYALDAWRKRVHDEICKLAGLSRDETVEITGNLDKIHYNPGELSSKLYLLSKNGKGDE